MLPNGALVDERTHSKLSDSALGEVLASLWPGDCQSCGTSLGSGKPALMVDDLQVLTRKLAPSRPPPAAAAGFIVEAVRSSS